MNTLGRSCSSSALRIGAGIAVFPTGLRYRVLESGRLVTKWNDFGLPDEIDANELPPGYPEDAPMPADD